MREKSSIPCSRDMGNFFMCSAKDMHTCIQYSQPSFTKYKKENKNQLNMFISCCVMIM